MKIDFIRPHMKTICGIFVLIEEEIIYELAKCGVGLPYKVCLLGNVGRIFRDILFSYPQLWTLRIQWRWRGLYGVHMKFDFGLEREFFKEVEEGFLAV